MRYLFDHWDEHGRNLQEIADGLDLTPPSVLRHLDNLVDESMVERRKPRGQRVPRYLPRQYFSALAIDRQAACIHEWSTPIRVHWRYPLASRVPDHDVQEALPRFLERLESDGLLYRHLASLQDQDIESRMRDGFTIAVYGSSARGQARSDSDIDVLVIQPDGIEAKDRITTLAAELNTWLDRPLDVRVVTFDGLQALPAAFSEELVREAMTVYDSFGSVGYFEHRRNRPHRRSADG